MTGEIDDYAVLNFSVVTIAFFHHAHRSSDPMSALRGSGHGHALDSPQIDQSPTS
jgi:hypothetical protein